MQWLESIGREVLLWLAQCGEAVILIGQTIKQLRQANWRHIIFKWLIWVWIHCLLLV